MHSTKEYGRIHLSATHLNSIPTEDHHIIPEIEYFRRLFLMHVPFQQILVKNFFHQYSIKINFSMNTAESILGIF